MIRLPAGGEAGQHAWRQVGRAGSQKRRQRRLKCGHDCHWSEGMPERQSLRRENGPPDRFLILITLQIQDRQQRIQADRAAAHFGRMFAVERILASGVSVAARSRTFGRCPSSGPMPVRIRRSGPNPCRTTRCRPSPGRSSANRATNVSASAFSNSPASAARLHGQSL